MVSVGISIRKVKVENEVEKSNRLKNRIIYLITTVVMTVIFLLATSNLEPEFYANNGTNKYSLFLNNALQLKGLVFKEKWNIP